MPEEAVPETKAPLWKSKKIQIGALAAVLVLGGGFFAFTKFMAPPPPPPVVVKPKAAATPAAPKAAAPSPALANKPAQAQATPGLSETQNAIAHAPVNAINTAKDVVGKREGSGQGREAVGAITEGETPAAPVAKSAEAPQAGATSSTIAPGVKATNDDVLAVAEASPAFRSFVANAKITGVFGANETARTTLNGRLVRYGDVIDSSLGISFDGYDYDKRQLIFKDKSGATVVRRYP